MGIIKFENQIDKKIYQSYNCVKTLFPEFNLVLGGTSALWVQNYRVREPKDLDIFIFGVTISEFKAYIEENLVDDFETPLITDITILEYVNTHPINVLFYDLLITLQPLHEIMRFKTEYKRYKLKSSKSESKHNNDIEEFIKTIS